MFAYVCSPCETEKHEDVLDKNLLVTQTEVENELLGWSEAASALGLSAVGHTGGLSCRKDFCFSLLQWLLPTTVVTWSLKIQIPRKHPRDQNQLSGIRNVFSTAAPAVCFPRARQWPPQRKEKCTPRGKQTLSMRRGIAFCYSAMNCMSRYSPQSHELNR